jgi:hypothetical protein
MFRAYLRRAVRTRARAREFCRTAGVAFVALSNLVLSAACHSANGADGGRMTLDREIFVPQFSGTPRAVVARSDGGVWVAGGGGSALAMALGPGGNPIWHFEEPLDPDVKGLNQSIYNGAVALENGNLLLCGEIQIKRPTLGLITILDRAGKVVDERHLIANNASEFFYTTFQRCLSWNEGVLLVADATNQTGTLTWLVTLDRAGAQTSQHLLRDVSGNDVVTGANGDLIFAESAGQQTLLTRMNRQLDVVARRTIESSAFGLTRLDASAAETKLIAYVSGGQKATIYTLGEHLEDAKPPRFLDHPISVEKGRAYALADGALALFGYVYRGGPFTAAMARTDSTDSTDSIHIFTPELRSFTVADAQSLGAGRFVAVRDRAGQPGAEESGVVIFWVTMR